MVSGIWKKRVTDARFREYLTGRFSLAVAVLWFSPMIRVCRVLTSPKQGRILMLSIAKLTPYRASRASLVIYLELRYVLGVCFTVITRTDNPKPVEGSLVFGRRHCFGTRFAYKASAAPSSTGFSAPCSRPPRFPFSRQPPLVG